MRRTPVLLPLVLLSCRYFPEAETYETGATRDAIGIDVQVAPIPEGPEAFLELSASSGRFELRCEEVQGTHPLIPAPDLDRPANRTVLRPGPDGKIYEGRIGWWEREDGPRPEWMIRNDSDTVRHKYAGMAGFGGFDFLIGERRADRTEPLLCFRDIGTHDNAGVVDFQVDAQGRVQLLDMDVDTSRNNRGKLLYLVGDPKTHRWEEAWLLHERPRFTSVSTCAILAGEPSTAFLWAIDGGRDPAAQGVFFAERRAGRFSSRTRIDPDGAARVVAARDSTGALLVVYQHGFLGKTILARLRRADGTWTEAASVPTRQRMTDQPSLFAIAPGKFVLREYTWAYSFDRKRNEATVRDQVMTVVSAEK